MILENLSSKTSDFIRNSRLESIENSFKSDELILQLDYCFDLEAIRDDVNTVLSRYPFGHTRQLCLTHTKLMLDSKEKIYAGTGTLPAGIWEYDFTEFNQEFKSTSLEQAYQKLLPHFHIGRVRIAQLPPRQCYSMHIDTSIYRYHLAVVTNPFSYITYCHGEMFQIPSDGHLYRMNTRLRHSAFNGGTEDRIHLLWELFPRGQKSIYTN